MFGNNDLESGADSSSEVISPMVTRSTPKQHEKTYNQQQSKILMMSTTDRRTESNATTETSTGRATIATKKVSWEKRCKRFGSLCMAIFLFAGGIVSLPQFTSLIFQSYHFYK